MTGEQASGPQDSADRQIYAYLDGAAHKARYQQARNGKPPSLFRIDVPTVLGTLALIPFVQALSTALGSRVGERTAEGLRALARKVLRRELESASSDKQRQTARSSNAPSTAAVVRIQFDEDVSLEGLLLLPTMDFSALSSLGDYLPVVRWLSDGKWHAVTLREGQIVDATWDVVEGCWRSLDAPDDWGEARRREL